MDLIMPGYDFSNFSEKIRAILGTPGGGDALFDFCRAQDYRPLN